MTRLVTVNNIDPDDLGAAGELLPLISSMDKTNDLVYSISAQTFAEFRISAFRMIIAFKISLNSPGGVRLGSFRSDLCSKNESNLYVCEFLLKLFLSLWVWTHRSRAASKLQLPLRS